MRTLVTGGAGFIGAHTIKRLIEAGDQVVCIDDFNDYYSPALKEERMKTFLRDYQFPIYRSDIRDLAGLRRIFQENKIDRVCHLAARAGVRASLIDPFVYETTNILGTLNLLELAKDFGVPKFVYASSSSVYGNNKKIPFAESDSVDNPISPYAATKKAGELFAHNYSYLYNLSTIGLRFFTVYGPWGRPDMALFKFADSILRGLPIEIYNFGKMKRDFTYIDDIVSGIMAALALDCHYEIINLGNSRSEELLRFVETIEAALGKKAVKKLLPLQPGDVPETCADITKAKALLNFSPRTGMETGVKNFVAWYREYYHV